MEKPGIIKKLEKKTNEELKQLDIGDILGFTNGYVMDGSGNIVGLNLYDANISDISFLKDFHHLTHLYINQNQIADISHITTLTALTKLSLWENQIADISPITTLTALTELDLNYNQIADISPITPLTALTKLHLHENQIADISPISPLTALTKLHLSENQIADISPISPLTALKELHLSENQIADISPISPLTALTKLHLSENQIADISPFIGLKNIERLDLNNNKITQLPDELVELGMEIKWKKDYSDSIILENNPLETPPIEIVKQGTEAVRNYFIELKKESVHLLHAKLLIVGNGEVGKTTLMKKLKDNKFKVKIGKEASTHGINIVPWELKCRFKQNNAENVKINFWDFGGQDIYHATHQFFLTKRSLYLFVWEVRKEEESRSFDYWLNIIKLLSANSPVIIVMNKSDERIKHIDEASFKEKFKNIVTFLQVSCVSGKGIPELTGQIRSSLSNMDHLQDKLPKVWIKIRDHLKKEKKDYISLDEYFKICQKFGLNEERTEFVSSYLHDLGVILHYRHDKLLENTVILNPEWATEAVYKLIDTRKIQENKGRFKFDNLKTYWDKTRFPRHKHAELVRLMEKFELCFPITDSDIHIVPELLPAERPGIDFGVYKRPGNLHFQYHYDFMPEGIITRFISRMYYLIKDDHFWKNGVELRFEDSTAVIISDLLNRKMKISVTGSCKSELLAITRNDFEHIHNTLNMEKNQHYYEMIPCNCVTCSESGEPHLFKHEVIKKFEAKKKSFTLCPISVEEVSLEKLLKGYELPKPKKDILKTLITTAHHLQGIAMTMKSDEDSRNGFIALVLSIHGIYVKDRGSSASGKSSGEVDIKIETPDRETEAIIEAFNLKSLDRTVIKSHLTKIFGYDTSGLAHNFIIVYTEVQDFLGLWKKYLNHIPGIDFQYKLLGKPEELETGFAEIKLARTKHLRQGKETTLYHLFVNMKPRR
jgi:small GTP-binding protein